MRLQSATRVGIWSDAKVQAIGDPPELGAASALNATASAARTERYRFDPS
jgi:hypothetical protein